MQGKQFVLAKRSHQSLSLAVCIDTSLTLCYGRWCLDMKINECSGCRYDIGIGSDIVEEK